jgi:hypothetical protein
VILPIPVFVFVLVCAVMFGAVIGFGVSAALCAASRADAAEGIQ